MAWEALNNIAADHTRRLVIVVNDNERSYSPTVGGLAHHLSTLRTTRGYERFLEWGKQVLGRTPVVGPPIYDALHGVKKGLKDVVAPQGMFEDLGLKYIGPIDGHDVEAVEHALRRARGFGGPVLVHCLTRKGLGYKHAEDDVADHFHGIGVIDPETGQPLAASGTAVDQGLLRRAGRDRRRAGRTSSASPRPCCIPTGLDAFAAAYPDRVFDVGIAEQHATTSAAGLALGGLHPVVAVYATFLNRAFDQVLMDVALHKCGVTFCLDRAGVTGPDGASHHGMWDMAFLQVVPGLRLAAPRDAVTLREELREALAVDDAPTVVRYPTGAVGADLPGPGAGRTASTSCAGTATTCCSSRSARWSRPASRWPTGARSRASGSPSSTRAGSSRCPPRSSGWLPAYAPWSSSRTACAAGSAARSRRPCATRG